MKKNILKTAVYAILILPLFIACEKDEVTQEDIIKDQQKIDLVINVRNASDGLMAVDSALVTVATSDGALSAGTDESGTVIFEDISITTSIPVTVTKTDFTSVNTVVNTSPNNYRQSQVSSTIDIYELSGPNMALIQGRLTIETDVTNREREAVPVGLVVRAFNNSITNNVAFIGTTDEDGNYEINVPVNSNGNDDIQMRFPEIYTDQTVAEADEDDYTIGIVQKPAYYSLESNALNNSIPGVPSVYAVVDAPASSTIGSGFGLTSIVIPTSVSSYSEAILINGGSGYTDVNDTILYLSEGANGDTAYLQVDIVNGSISNIDAIVNNGAQYTSQPTVNTNFAGGSGAVIEIQFRALYDIVITDNGSDYIGFPEAFYNYGYFSSNILVSKTNDIDLSSYTEIVNGKIVNNNLNDGDTVATFVSATPPEFTIVDPESKPVIVSIPYNYINENSGEITNIIIENYGQGYDPSSHPAITFNTVAGYGSGAEAVVNINENGSLDNIIITNPGSDYIRNVNDFNDDGTLFDDEENPVFSYNTYYNGFRYIYDVDPGSQYIRSAHYGTGVPEED